MSNNKKSIKCPCCGKHYVEKDTLYAHLEEQHNDILKGMSAAQFYFNTKNKKTSGACVICGKPTTWNEKTEKYNRLCSEKCKNIYREQFKNRMVNKYGKVHLLDDANQQKKMLANRSISGTYKWKNRKGETGFTGSYEREFLEFLDLMMEWDPLDIMAPSPHVFQYTSNGKTHIYIPDFYIPSLNLIIEIKDGGSNPNNHHKIQDVDKIKEKAKDEVMKDNGIFNYVKVTDKNHVSFLMYLSELKNKNMHLKDDKKDPLVIINESSIANITPVSGGYVGERIIDDPIDLEDDDELLNENGIADILLEDRVVKAVKRNDYKQNGISRNVNYYINFLNTYFTEAKIQGVIKEFKNYNKPEHETGIVNDAMCLYEAKLIFEEIKKGKTLYDKISTHESYYRKYAKQIEDLYKISIKFDNKYHKGVVYKDFKDDLDVQIDRVRRLQTQQKKILKEAVNSINCLLEQQINALFSESGKVTPQSTIYISTDWHLVKRNDATDEVYIREDWERLITGQISTVGPNDIFIYLGDLADDGTQSKRAWLKEQCQRLKGGLKIFIIGNNDDYDVSFYKACGFDIVCDYVTYKNVIFSHGALEEFDYGYNVHGHIHGYAAYTNKKNMWHQVDAYKSTELGHPLTLQHLLNMLDTGEYLALKTNVNKKKFHWYPKLITEADVFDLDEFLGI